MAFDQSPLLIYYLLSIRCPRPFWSFLFRMYQDTPGGTSPLYEGLSFNMICFFPWCLRLSFLPTVLETIDNGKVLRHTPLSMVEYYLIKVVGLFVDFLLSIELSSMEYVVRHVNTSPMILGAFLLILRSLVCGSRSGLDPKLLSSQLMLGCGKSPYMDWLSWAGGCRLVSFPEWMQAIGKCLPTYQWWTD